jgi:protein ImuA
MDVMPPAVSSVLSAAVSATVAAAAAARGGPRGAALRQPAAPAPRSALPAPEALHPALWLGHQLGRHAEQALPSGFATLDAQLPGCGWPRRALTELLLPHAGVGEIRLLAPALAATQRAGRLVMLFDPPARLAAWPLARLGLDVAQLLLIETRDATCSGTSRDAGLWALEQALKSGHVGAVLAWLPPRLHPDRVRRLQLAAQAHDGAAFVLRELAAAQRPSAAPLRLALQCAGPDRLALRVLKRRGPPLEVPLQLALPPVLSAAGRQRAQAGLCAPAPAEPRALRPARFVDLA